jgi:phenylalanyl-tRNA synthetase beta chain
MKISYNWLKWYIPNAPEPEKLADIFTYHLAEVESLEKREDGDVILDIKILPNRAHDLLSHKGIAGEIASLLNIKYADPTPMYKVPNFSPTDLKIEIESENCRRYSGRIIRHVKVGPSPEWVVKHLASIGQRSINNMVDASNLVMYNSGQPTHVFDLDKVKEKLVIRQAKDGEELTTLDNKECKLKTTDMVVADASRALAIAGVKGGKIAEVDGSTVNIILEVANFDPTSVRKTAQALSIFTDARKRFENNLTPELVPDAMQELTALIFEMCPEATYEEAVDMYPKKQEPKKLAFRTEKISKVLGIKITPEEIKDIFKRYNFSYVETADGFEIEVPPMRFDLEIEEDMAEEIGRILGYDRLKGEVPKVAFQPRENDTYAKTVWARNKLTDEGYSEVMTSSFRNDGKVEVLASASDKNFLRTNLLDGIKESGQLNKSNSAFLGLKEIKIFEIGTVWNPEEKMVVAYADEKGDKVEKSLDEFCKDMPKDFSLAPTTYNLTANFKMWSLFPFIARDVAVWVPEDVSSGEVSNLIKENMGDIVVRGPELFDEFKKDGKVSYAFRIVFQSYDRTLTDAEVNEVMNKISQKIMEKEGWQVR